jgi:hypothetical protein
MRRALALAAVALAGLAASPAAALALTVGLGDQKAAVFSDARLRALHLGVARLIVPWDAATTEPAAVQGWLDAVAAAGMQPHVAFEHRRADRCPGSPCLIPTRAQYRAAVAAFHARFPQVRVFTTWNEANHESQPVSGAPEAVAGYYEELTSICPACTVVAGDVLDSGSYVRWLQRFEAATSTDPQLWGLHNYADATYGRTTGTDAVLATVPGQLWIEETGGIVTLRNSAGRETLTSSEPRAAAAIDQAFAIARTRSRITRMYVYQWQAAALDRFDAGLLRPDGTPRPSYDRLVADLAALPVATTSATPTLRWSATWSKLAPRRLVVRVRCAAAAGRCSGRVALTVRTARTAARAATSHRLAVRAYRTTSARTGATWRLKIGPALRRRLRAAAVRRLAITVTPALPAGARATTTLTLRRPA